MKRFIFTLLVSMMVSFASAQVRYVEYSKYQLPYYSAVMSVEDMESGEIKIYNEIATEDDGLALINASRSTRNLMAAPPIILAFHHDVYEDNDTLPSQYVGAKWIGIEIMNTTVKVIKSATFKLYFENELGQIVYDIKTGNQYCSLTFNNLSKCTRKDNFLRSWTEVELESASKKTLFYNSKGTILKIGSIDITFTDGSKAKTIALWDNKSGRLFEDGPLSPYLEYKGLK